MSTERTNQPEQRVQIFLFDYPDPNTDERRYVDVEEIPIRHTSAGKFDAATQAALQKMIDHVQHPDHGVHIQWVTE